MSERFQRSLIRLGKVLFFGILSALVVALQASTQSGDLDLDLNVILVTVLAAAAAGLEKWLAWEKAEDPDLE